MTSDDLHAAALVHFERLVSFDTTSRDSNLKLIEYVEGVLAPLGVTARRVFNDDRSKANLYATLGPSIAGGVVLSGHTDVVPVDGQAWDSDPFVLTQRGERLYGRGTCDMKGFLALALAGAPAFVRGTTPVHLAFSYDEEVGCLGAPSMIREMVRDLPAPLAVVVGEPTDMEVVCGHKSISTWRVTVTGHEAHSSLTHLGVSANMVAVRLMQRLADLADALERSADVHSTFCPRHATLTIGQVNGGTAVNILARECVFVFDLRCPPGPNPDTIVAPFVAACAAEGSRIAALFPGCGVAVERRSQTPGLAPEPGSAAEDLVRRLTSDNGPARAVSYAAEAGQFQEAGYSVVICGPGSIEQAHQPNEYIETAQFRLGATFMTRLIEAMR